jgi:hypothetical protein
MHSIKKRRQALTPGLSGPRAMKEKSSEVRAGQRGRLDPSRLPA